MTKESSLMVEAIARNDYSKGCSQDDNPYKEGTLSHEVWQKVVDDLYYREHLLAANYFDPC